MQWVAVVAFVLASAGIAAAACSTDMDCSLNGVCSSDQCLCDKPWTGPECGILDVEPVAPIQGYGMAPNLTSWGGNVVLYDGVYHLYVAEMVNECLLNEWSRNSRISHATSPTPTGPYTFKNVAVPVWAHNPQVVLGMVEPGGQPMFVLFHIGTGQPGKSPPENCTSGFLAPFTRIEHEEMTHNGAPTSNVHVANSPDGPWTPLLPSPPSCNNPAPMQHPNGTWFLLCDSKMLFRAQDLKGPWMQYGKDAFLYLDKRGRWHVLFHVYNATTPCGVCDGGMVSGHAFSEDGIGWQSSVIQPFSNKVQMTTGETVTLSTRERPKLLFAPDGTPTHLLNGVCHASTCPPTPGVNCKYNNWDYTLVQPLKVE